MLSKLPFIAWSFLIGVTSVQAGVPMGTVSPWYENQLTIEKGATISSPAEPSPGYDLRTIIDPGHFPPPKGGERFVFADKPQHEVFTIDIGRMMTDGFCLIRVHPGDRTVHGNPGGRKPERMKVEVSADGTEGHWKTLRDWPSGEVPLRQSMVWDSQPIRYLRFDLGDNTDRIGSRMGSILLYPRCHQPPVTERLAELSGLLRNDVPGLEPFRAALGRGDTSDAVGSLRAHFAKAPITLLDGKEMHDQRAEDWQHGTYRDEDRTWQLPPGIKDWYYAPFDLSHEPPSYWVAGHHFWYLPDWYTKHPEEHCARWAAEMIGRWLVDVPCPGVHEIKDGADSSLVPAWEAIRVADRLGGLCRALAVFAPDRRNFHDETWVNLLYSIHEHGQYMAFVTPGLGGNWLTWANDRLIRTACEYREFKDSTAWLVVGKAAFETVVLRDVSCEGKETEDSTYYCLRATNEILGSFDAFVDAGVPLDPRVVERVKRALDFPAWAHLPDGRNPGIGDMGSVDAPHDRIPLVDRYAAKWGRDDLVYINTRGETGRNPEQTSRAFLEDGFFVMRSNWEDGLDARHLIFRSPPAHHVGHGHRDGLAVLLYAWGRPLLIDPGMTIYGKQGSENYRTTAMHNTITVDGKSQAHGPGGKVATWETLADHDFADASHQLYQGVRHRRRVIFVKPDYYVLIDDVTGDGNRQLDWNYHFLVGAAPSFTDGAIHTNFPEGGNLAILPLGEEGFARNETKPFRYVQASQEIDSIGWLLRREGALPQRLVTLLVPYKGPIAPELHAVLADNTIEVLMAGKRDRIAWRNDVGHIPTTAAAETGTRPAEPVVAVTRSGR